MFAGAPVLSGAVNGSTAIDDARTTPGGRGFAVPAASSKLVARPRRSRAPAVVRTADLLGRAVYRASRSLIAGIAWAIVSGRRSALRPGAGAGHALPAAHRRAGGVRRRHRTPRRSRRCSSKRRTCWRTWAASRRCSSTRRARSPSSSRRWCASRCCHGHACEPVSTRTMMLMLAGVVEGYSVHVLVQGHRRQAGNGGDGTLAQTPQLKRQNRSRRCRPARTAEPQRELPGGRQRLRDARQGRHRHGGRPQGGGGAFRLRDGAIHRQRGSAHRAGRGTQREGDGAGGPRGGETVAHRARTRRDGHVHRHRRQARRAHRAARRAALQREAVDRPTARARRERRDDAHRRQEGVGHDHRKRSGHHRRALRTAAARQGECRARGRCRREDRPGIGLEAFPGEAAGEPITAM